MRSLEPDTSRGAPSALGSPNTSLALLNLVPRKSKRKLFPYRRLVTRSRCANKRLVRRRRFILKLFAQSSNIE